MKFYELPAAVENFIKDPKTRPYVRIAFEKADGTVFVNDSDITSCEINSYKETTGGIINNGEIVLDNYNDTYNPENDSELCEGLCVEIWYCFENKENCFLRFMLYVDGNGFQTTSTGHTKACTIKLVDLSNKLKQSNKNWTENAIFTHCVICDKSKPEKSLVHLIAKRASLSANDIDCSYLPYEVNYVTVANDVWTELSEIARAYEANLECGKDKPLSFSESTYDTSSTQADESSFELLADDITQYRRFDENGDYSNNIRLKYTHYATFEKTEIWNYNEGSIWYDENMVGFYPFTDDERKICKPFYNAPYTVKNSNGKECDVVYAEDIDDKETFSTNILYGGNTKFKIANYDTSTYKNKAIIQLDTDGQMILLKKCAINGKGICSEPNTCVYVKDEEEIQKHGLRVMNVTNKYLSDTEFGNIAQCKSFANRNLDYYKKLRSGYFIKTNIAIVGARVGACMRVNVSGNISGAGKIMKIEQLTLMYKKDAAFETSLWVKSV